MLAARRAMQIGLPTVNPIQYIAHVATTAVSGVTTASPIFSPSSAIPAGHKATLQIRSYAGTASSQQVTSVTDSAGNIWTVDANGQIPDGRTSAAMCSSNLTVGLQTSTVITINFSAALGSASSVNVTLDDWLFPSTNTGVDKYGTGKTNFAKAGSAQLSAATTGSTDLILSNTAFASSGGTITGPSGYTAINTAVYYLLPTTSQRFSASLSWTTSANASQVIVAYAS